MCMRVHVCGICVCAYVFEKERDRAGERKGKKEGWREGKYKGNHDQEGRDFGGGREVNRICDIKAELGGCLKGEKRPAKGCRGGIICEGSQGG